MTDGLDRGRGEGGVRCVHRVKGETGAHTRFRGLHTVFSMFLCTGIEQDGYIQSVAKILLRAFYRRNDWFFFFFRYLSRIDRIKYIYVSKGRIFLFRGNLKKKMMGKYLNIRDVNLLINILRRSYVKRKGLKNLKFLMDGYTNFCD